MARRKDSPQKAAMREMMRDYLKNNDISIKDGTDVNSIMRDMMSVLLRLLYWHCWYVLAILSPRQPLFSHRDNPL